VSRNWCQLITVGGVLIGSWAFPKRITILVTWISRKCAHVSVVGRCGQVVVGAVLVWLPIHQGKRGGGGGYRLVMLCRWDAGFDFNKFTSI
jgi:hypothetical protein